MPMNPQLRVKFLGGLLGTAVGDAIGELAFVRRSRSSLLNSIQQRNLLTHTDDTVMAIGLAEAILAGEGKLIPQKVGEIFHSHYKQDPRRGYGRGPPIIFRTVAQSGKSYVDVAKTLFNGEGSFGNGAAMRIAPVGLYFFDADDIYEHARKSAIPTHAHRLGIEGGALLAKLISLVVDKDPQTAYVQEEQSKILHALSDFTKTKEYHEKLEEMTSLLHEDKPVGVAANVLGSGEKVTALDSVPFVIFAFLHQPSSFQDALLDTVIHSGDADTIGAMLGGVLGSYHGYNAVPEGWIRKIESREYITQLATDLATLKGRTQKS